MGYSMMQLYAAAVEKAKTTEPKGSRGGIRDVPGSADRRGTVLVLP